MTPEMKEKFRSRKFLIVVWAASLLSIMVILGIILNRNLGWMLGVGTVLASIPAFYVGIRAFKQSGGT